MFVDLTVRICQEQEGARNLMTSSLDHAEDEQAAGAAAGQGGPGPGQLGVAEHQHGLQVQFPVPLSSNPGQTHLGIQKRLSGGQQLWDLLLRDKISTVGHPYCPFKD